MATIEKQRNNDSGKYTETITHTILMCNNVIGNNNKFYSLELQKIPNEEKYQIFSHYGRISRDIISGGIYEVRNYVNKTTAKLDYERIIKSKMRGKTKIKDGIKYKEAYEKVNVISSSVGSSNIKEKSSVVKKNNAVSKDVFKNFNKKEQSLISLLEEENIHDIMSQTTMVYSSTNGLQTPLGALTIDHLQKAEMVLEEIQNEVKIEKTSSNSFKLLNSKYFSLIPRSLGSQISEFSLINNANKILNEYDLIQQMKTAIDIQEIKTDSNFNIGFYMEQASNEEFLEIQNIYNSRKRKMHSDVYDFKLKNVYKVENFKERKRFEIKADQLQKEGENKIRNNEFDYKEIDVFHGSKNANILSILMNGFYVPPENAIQCTARMFGNGVYGADISTKSLRYSTGGWSQRLKNKNNNKVFLFISRFAMGKTYCVSKQSKLIKGYDSIFASGGYDLKNNEYIVPNPNQTTISYLLEIER